MNRPEPGTRQLHLTFDDGPDPRWTPAVLEALARADARATFFVMTTKVQEHPLVLEAILQAGHTVGLHCHEHLRHTTLSRQEIEQDTDTALSVLAAHGSRPALWRVPWGVQAPATTLIAETRTLTLVHWTADTEDWRGGTALRMLERIDPDLRPGGIVLAHDGIGPGALRDSCEETVALVEPLVRRARSLDLSCTAILERQPA